MSIQYFRRCLLSPLTLTSKKIRKRANISMRFFNDSAIISRTSTALLPLSENEKQLLLPHDVDASKILRCRVDADVDCNAYGMDDAIFDCFRNENNLLPARKLMNALTATGLRRKDPRLREMMKKLNNIYKMNQENGVSDSILLDRVSFKSVVNGNIELVGRALKQQFVIPDFKDFTQVIENFYWKCKLIDTGKVASYIPQLAKFSPDHWGVSLCTVDGQRFSIGDSSVPFTIQSAGKPLNYAVALTNLGADTVHRFVGQEPSGRMFNELVLDCSFKPHNPMVNAGAIVTCSLLLKLIESEMKVAEKFDWMCQHYRELAGEEYLGFNNAIFLSEREAADRNYAIGFYMKENRCFPPNSNLREIMDFYFQMCSLEVNCETLSIIASTLANGGICPTTNKQVLNSAAVRNVLSLMHSCGMYDYSGQFAFKVGLPAKSGVSGCTMVVVPNVLGLCLWSPPLDAYGNSVRGVKFCEEMIQMFNFHHYDNLRHTMQKRDPRRYKYEAEATTIVNLLYAAASGDIAALKRCHLAGVNMQMSDCNRQTALHVAASNGHTECTQFLLEVCKVHPTPIDKWGRTPLDEAKTFGHTRVIELLTTWTEGKLMGQANNKSTLAELKTMLISDSG